MDSSSRPAVALPDTITPGMAQLPQNPRPIVVIGAGGIVHAAHLPAYARAGFHVAGIMDPAIERAKALAHEYGIARVAQTVEDAVRNAPDGAVFDVAVPASQLAHVLPHLPDGSPVLMQKPMGETLQEAELLRSICRRKSLIAVVNFTMRYSPNNLAVRALADAGLLGQIHDLEAQVRTYTPWSLWTFLASAPRLEILYHSIHYFDLIRSWLGNPASVAAKTVKSPHSPGLAATKTTAILDYGESTRVFVATNHSHNFGPARQDSFMQWEGIEGAARMTIGVNLDYPNGVSDAVEYAVRGSNEPAWIAAPIAGNNFPDGFANSMSALQRYVEGSGPLPSSHFEDAYQTMELVEALYESSRRGAEPVALHR